MNKVEVVKERRNRESVWTSQIVALFDREQVDKSVQLLVACGEILSPTVRADHRLWLDIRARSLIAAKLSTIYECQLGKSNTPYGKAKLWAELAARWMVSGNDTVAHMDRARKAILRLLRAHPPSAEIMLKSFQTIYNHARKNIKKGNVPISKLAPFISPLPSDQCQVTVQALMFAKASAHAIKWSDYLELSDEVKRQIDIIKRMPNVVIIFNKLTLQLREDWQQQWTHAESNQILAFYEMIYKTHPIEESNTYIEALLGVSYSLCKGPNIINKWLNAQLRRIQKKIPNFQIKDCVSVEDINTFRSGYIKSEISIDDVYKFLKYIYSSLNKAARKVVNIVIEQAALQNYSHAINFGALNANTKYKCLSLLIQKVPRVQWTKIAQIAVDLQRDPWHAILKARTTVREFIDLANFGKIGMSVLREKFKTNFEGFIHDGILSKEEILDMVEKARLTVPEEMEEVLELDGLLLAPTLANVHFVVIEDRIFTHSSTANSEGSVTSQQDEEKVLLYRKNEVNDVLEEISVSLEDEEYTEQSSINSAINLRQKVLIAQEDELIDVLGQFKKQLEEDIQQRSANSLQQKVKLAKQDELNEAQEQIIEHQDIQQRKINTLISLQKEVQIAQNDEQKYVIEKFNKQQDVLLQRYKKIAFNWQKEIQKTQQVELEQFSKQQEISIQHLYTNSAINLLQGVQMDQLDEVNDAPDQFSKEHEDAEQRYTNSAFSLQLNVHKDQRAEQQYVLEQFGNKQKKLADILQCTVQEATAVETVAEDRIHLGRDDLPEAARKLPDIGTEITKTQLPELYGRAMAVVQDIKAARVICKYLNIVGRRSVFHPFVKKDKRRYLSSRFRPIPAELRYAAAIFGVKMPDDPVDDDLANELTNPPRPVIKEISFDVKQHSVEVAELRNAAVILGVKVFCGTDEDNLNDGSANELTNAPSPEIKESSSDVEQHSVEISELRNAATTFGLKVPSDPDEDNPNDGSDNEITKALILEIDEFSSGCKVGYEFSDEEKDELILR